MGSPSAEPDPDTGPGRQKSPWSYLNVGLQYALTVGLCSWGGTWLDQRFKCEPWGVLCCTLFGVALATYLLLKEVA